MKTEPGKLIGLIAGVLGLYVTVATMVSDAKLLPGLYWIGTAILVMLGCMFFAGLAYGGIVWAREELFNQPQSERDDQLALWGVGAAAVLGLILTLSGLDDPGSKDEARTFGALHVVGLLGLVGGALLLLALYNDRNSKQPDPPA